MKRSGVIAQTIILAVVGVLLPLSATIYAAWTLSAKTEEDRLMDIAHQAVTRTERSILNAAGVLRGIDGNSSFTACSDAHIAEMRRLTVNSRGVKEIGYLDDGVLKCTSWGLVTKRIEKLKADFTIGDDIEAWVSVPPLFSGADPMTVVQVGKHNALIDPIRPIDLLADAHIRIAIIAPNGAQAANLNGMASADTERLARKGSSGLENDHVYAIASEAGWTAIAVNQQDELLEHFQGQLLVFLPFGAFAALFIVVLVVRMSRKRLSPLSELQIAVRNREFIVHYQPIVELATGHCVGAEALVRWKRPDGSLVRPDLFIPLAEQSGLIQPITDQVIDAVVKDLNELLVQHRALHVAINFCAEDIRTGRILETVEKRISRTGIENRQIWMEATERGLLDITEASKTIAEARTRGHKVAIDDFGTGYSSLQYLQSLPLDALKIDKSFIDTINKQTATSSVVSYIIDMAKALKLSVVAEGVETKEQADYLIEHGVEFAQGWYYSKPMPADLFIAYVHSDLQRQASKIVPLRRAHRGRR
ncbi:sensor c-di-GMP phosphodiesterase, contains CSS-motif sensor and EAL domain [Rhizobium sp. NFR07]|uniref:EAL domain-containing protein n=1 Tax=Rhizobium sp. NFR07 TaxID=1566262 RepID=UPI0008F3A132|nr:EAL domain-containing protein [Rhizobium sp. NFR07]SFB04349.1 sensor c-di-GMP phosphodiesterase, contains CSS-motif sensor and EAL domain [Rhizobium sp. NFR07]